MRRAIAMGHSRLGDFLFSVFYFFSFSVILYREHKAAGKRETARHCDDAFRLVPLLFIKELCTYNSPAIVNLFMNIHRATAAGIVRLTFPTRPEREKK